MPTKRLYRTNYNKMIGGVCNGIAEYFDIDPTIVRLIWTAAALLWGSGLVAYIVALIIMPVKTDYSQID